MNVEIFDTYHYGAWELCFRKTFTLPFAPFLGLIIIDEVKDVDASLNIEMIEHQGKSIRIQYWYQREEFEVDIRNRWLFPVRDDVIDNEIRIHEALGWERTDRTDIIQLKDLMQRDYKRDYHYSNEQKEQR